jgi:hypothetical protein
MKDRLAAALLAALSALSALGVRADEPPQATRSDEACLKVADNLILGPRTEDRPLPLLSGDPVRGFRPACSVPWSTLSPKNRPLAILGCFARGSLLRMPNDTACGRSTGPLWVDRRWVVISRDLTRKDKPAATCRKLESNALAASRDFDPECVPASREMPPADTTAPAGTAAPATPASSNPTPR